jgi:hypothetical protein
MLATAIRNLKSSLRNTDYRYTARSLAHDPAVCAVEINASNEFHCHTHKVAGII